MSPTATLSALGILFATIVVLGIVVRRLKLPFILSYILAGFLLQPLFSLSGVGLFQHLQPFSRFGVAFLLFLIGLRLNFQSLRQLGSRVLKIGFLQIILTTLAIATLLFFVTPSSNLSQIILIATAFSFSSTIVATKIIGERRDNESLYAKLAISILIFQDIAALVLIAASAIFTTQSHFLMLSILAFLIKLLTVFLIVIISLKLLPKIERAIAREGESLFIFSLAICLIYASIFQALGIGVELGALTAGILLAPSFIQREIASKVEPVRNLFLALFLTTIGASAKPAFLISHAAIILIGTVSILTIKTIITALVLKGFGYSKSAGAKTALAVSQISEFSLLSLLILGTDGILTPVATAIFIGTVVGSAILLEKNQIVSKLFFWWKNSSRHQETLNDTLALGPEIILFGAHRLGEGLIKSLRKVSANILVIDNNPEITASLKASKIPHLFGDGGETEFLESLKLNRLQMLVSTIPDLESNLTLAAFLKRKHLTPVKIFLANQLEEAKILYENGADYVILPHYLGKEIVGEMIEKRGLDKGRYEILRNKHLKQL